MKVGIIVTPFPSEEIWKRETIPIDERRPWLRNVMPHHRIRVKDMDHVSDDIAIAYCLKNRLKPRGHTVDIISPLDVDALDRVKATQITFLIIYDLLEAFHTLPTELFEKVKGILQQPNVYPNKEYQNFVNHKDIYYSYFRQKGIPVLPNIYISKLEYDANEDAALQKVLGLETGDDGKIIGKPIFGQESIDFFEFNPPFNVERFQRYFERIFKSYKGVLFQPYIHALKEKSEYKCMFFGDQLSYIVEYRRATNEEIIHDAHDIELRDITAFASKVFLNLPSLSMYGKDVPRLITRIDVGCCYGEHRYFVSEVEFVPSLFAPAVERVHPNKLIDVEITEQMLTILDQVKDIRIIHSSSEPCSRYFALMLNALMIIVLVAIFLMCVKIKVYYL